MGIITKCIVGFIMISLLAAFISDPMYFIGALSPAWEGVTIIGKWIVSFFVNLPGWLKELVAFWKNG